jgi:hypothetical protein
VGFVVNEVEMGQVFSEYFVFIPPISIIPPLLHTHCNLSANVTRGTSGRRKGIFNESSALWDSGEHWREKYCRIAF